MRTLRGLLIGVTLFFSVFAKGSEESHGAAPAAEAEVEKLPVYDLRKIPSDALLPTTLWEKIETFGRDERKKEAPEALNQRVEIQHLTMVLRLQEVDPGTLVAPEFKLRLGAGGGTVDLSHFVKAERGRFYLQVILPAQLNTAPSQIFFLGGTKPRNIGPRVWGLGCRTYLDVTHYFLTEMKSKGLLLDTQQLRHLSLFGGSFFISVYKQTQQYIARLTLQDSRHKDLFCHMR